ncbi:MAG TPA: sulfite exporter TauE/SafE family protein [Thermotogota bacterium]|nr:sulfite exporter TauE/SafE family protein [Thermotogota bacterium]HRW33975.1 sulfite exporter TauE/SafE family protein [Thermotogota bacterium]
MNDFWIFIVVGFLAQIVDGALGMAYGVTSNSMLLGLGVSPAISSASVHFAEIFTTLISGISHLKLGNVDQALFKKLVIPGIIGGIIGAYLLIQIPSSVIKPIIGIYLGLMGVRILMKAFSSMEKSREYFVKNRFFYLLGLMGGFFDAMGGGGWGPIVTTTLVADGKNPRQTIGSVNASEFFVTVAEVMAFLTLISQFNWFVIGGLIIGGGCAAPVAALITKRLKFKALMLILGTVIIGLSIRTVILSF